MLCALIMAGGKGERFWPLSTEDKPKQFLSLIGERTMVQATVDRIIPSIPIERIFIVTCKIYIDLIKFQLPELPIENIIIEPVGRNTAPCIALSAFYINKYYEDATIAVLPSDHLIENQEAFLKVLQVSQDYLNDNENAIITCGMHPTRPEIGYGYIKCGETDKITNQEEIKKVDEFVEKPDFNTARKYLEDGNYLWNSGIFIWKSKTILNLTNKYLKNTYDILSEIAMSEDSDYDRVLDEKYDGVQNISVDYGIMERSEEIYVIPCDVGWDDVGSWLSIERYKQPDKDNNICFNKVQFLNSKDNIVISNTRNIKLIGVEGLYIIEKENEIYIGKKAELDTLKDLKNILD